MSKLEDLCRPLLELLCNYCAYASTGSALNADTLNWKIHLCMNDIAVKCEEDPALKREYSRIERALVFFVDYTVKEGKFPFRNEWNLLARNYNELSGDEKFFDMLSENLDDPEASERLQLFYLLMGLGFDGIYANNQEFVERRMRLCATRFAMPEQVTADKLFTPPASFPEKRSGKSKVFAAVLILSFIFAAGALAYNFYQFRSASAAYKKSLEKAAQKASLFYTVVSGKSSSGVQK